MKVNNNIQKDLKQNFKVKQKDLKRVLWKRMK